MIPKLDSSLLSTASAVPSIIHGTSVQYGVPCKSYGIKHFSPDNRTLITYIISILPSEKVHIPNDPEHLDPFAVIILPFH